MQALVLDRWWLDSYEAGRMQALDRLPRLIPPEFAAEAVDFVAGRAVGDRQFSAALSKYKDSLQ
jgi:hypothetical protein